MRALFLPFRSDVNAPARSVEHSADAFTSIDALSAWLKAQGDVSSSPELLRLRAAVAVLAKKAKPKKEDVRPLFAKWDVQRVERQNERPLAMLIAELREAVFAEGSRLRATALAAQRGVSGSSATGEATSAAQPAMASDGGAPPSSLPGSQTVPLGLARCLKQKVSETKTSNANTSVATLSHASLEEHAEEHHQHLHVPRTRSEERN